MDDFVPMRNCFPGTLSNISFQIYCINRGSVNIRRSERRELGLSWKADVVWPFFRLSHFAFRAIVTSINT